MPNSNIFLAAKGYIAAKLQQYKYPQLFVSCHSESEAKRLYQQLSFFSNPELVWYFPSYDTMPYDQISPNSDILMQRTQTLVHLANLHAEQPFIVVTNATNLALQLPAASYFKGAKRLLKIGAKIALNELAKYLVDNGYVRSNTAIEPGEFALRGEILDVILSKNHAYRLSFSWQEVESIKQFDPYSQISKNIVQAITITPVSELILNAATIECFKSNFLKLFGVNYIQHPLYLAITSGHKYRAYEYLLPLFYQQSNSLLEYAPQAKIIYSTTDLLAIENHRTQWAELYQARKAANKNGGNNFYFTLPPEKFLSTTEEVKTQFAMHEVAMPDVAMHDNQNTQSKPITNILAASKLANTPPIEKLKEQLYSSYKQYILVILCPSTAIKNRLIKIIENYELHSVAIDNLTAAKHGQINVGIASIDTGFSDDKYIFLASHEIIDLPPLSKAKPSKKLKNILAELDNIKAGQLVVHTKHGIGRFEQIEPMRLDGITHDFLKIIYADNDIFYLPVENLSQIKKYGSELVPLDKLGSVSWQKRQSKVRGRIKDIAKQLIKLSAARLVKKAAPIDINQAKYSEFCQKFQFTETEDQLNAIEDITQDFTSGRLMDRLVCGDVGFGKTEVAMRAACMVAFDQQDASNQIAVIVPTTILCRQHYLNFQERFAHTGLTIVQLSRLVSPKAQKIAREQINSGEARIIIGTHALLAESIKFANLRLIIVDEEQHFGVTQKEGLKKLRLRTHILSLSATPIPRTLQMSMVGIKDLSIIATPPINRLPVRTVVSPFDAVIIRDSLMREKLRGGLSFFVVPRIEDIAWVEQQLKLAVPELHYKVAHGQMSASKVDDIMHEFYSSKFDILISTTIIESGIDIPIANTIMIYKANMLGLSQLYQLRGRIGRSKVQGFAYLLLPSKGSISEIARQRLELLENIQGLGAGFTIASYDMDLRGFGNLVGSQQSGQIKEVGVELYQDMISEAIEQLQLDPDDLATGQTNLNPNINLAIDILIPQEYITDDTLRLAIYRRASNLQNQEEIEQFQAEMYDRFGGPLPTSFANLLSILELKLLCKKIGIESIDSGPKGFVIKFTQVADFQGIILPFIQQNPAQTKLDASTGKLLYLVALNKSNLLQECRSLLQRF